MLIGAPPLPCNGPPPLPGMEEGWQEQTASLQTRSIHRDDAVVGLCEPDYLKTLMASSCAALWLFSGLTLLGGAESWTDSATATISLRVAAWMLLYQLPMQVKAIPNIRYFSTNEFDASVSFSGVAYSPPVLQILWFGIYIFLTCLYIGEPYQHLGYVPIYGIGHILVIMVGDALGPKMAPALSEAWAMKTGPPMLGFAMLGFFAVTSAYGVAERYTSEWLGIFLPVTFSCYEVLGTITMSRVFEIEFLGNLTLRRMYSHTNQGVVLSLMVGLLHAMAEGGRLALILTRALRHDGNGWLFAITAGFIWNVFSRLGFVSKAADIVLGIQCTRYTLLLQQVKFCLGYPRFFAVLAMALARLSMGTRAVSKKEMNTAVAIFLQFVAEVLEDLVVKLLAWLGAGFNFIAHSEPPEDLTAKARSRLQQRFSLLSPATVVPVTLPDTDLPEADLQAIEEECQNLLLTHHIAFCKAFGILPYWAHFAIAMTAQFHTVMFIILFSDGLPSILGFCPYKGYNEISQGIIFWPVQQGSCA
mmetsp:Transcript_43843/g.78805  ORF Transcript_43843/g.78805 Transcript_43843/m.78805 type:complete len:530 (+) Transcript_43843:26-1615(+)